jgi:hypothetical protein
MHPELNPYSPGAGRRPPALVGRQAEIDAFDLLVARTRGSQVDRGIVMHGLRGVGKTVLLNRFKSQAEGAGWITLELEGGRSAQATEVKSVVKLARELVRIGRRVPAGPARARALGAIGSFALRHGTGAQVPFEPLRGRADSGDLEVDFQETIDDITSALGSKSPVAVGLFVDELQDVDPQLLDAVLAVQHRCSQAGRPFYLVAAGLTDLPGRLSDLRSYSERLFDYRLIGQLDPAASREALVAPAIKNGATFTDGALDLLLGAADGYPYFLQTFGRETWNAALEKQITAEDAEEGLRIGREALDSAFYPARWARATPAERRYLTAMSDLGSDECRTSDIADSLGVPITKLGTVRQQLLTKGILSAPERGVVAFTVPGMRAFVERQFNE